MKYIKTKPSQYQIKIGISDFSVDMIDWSNLARFEHLSNDDTLMRVKKYLFDAIIMIDQKIKKGE